MRIKEKAPFTTVRVSRDKEARQASLLVTEARQASLLVKEASLASFLVR